MEQKRVGITIAELLTVAVVVVGACLMFWKTTDVRLSALELRMNTTERASETVNTKLDKLQESVNDIKVTLQNKEDKK